MALIEDKTPKPRSPAPQHDPVFSWPTPNQQDFLFWVEKNADLPKNKAFVYDDPYWDAVKYPDHKLVLVTPQTPDKWSRWYYASARITQDAYNWEHSQADIGGTKFDTVERSYVNLRADYDPTTPAQGAAMPNVPENLFTGTYVLAGRKEIRLGADLDALFVAEQHAYVRKTTLRQLGVDPLNGKMLYEDTTLYYRGEAVASTTIEALFAAPSNAFWGLQTDGTQRKGQQLSTAWFAVITEQVVGGTFSGGAVAVDSFTSNENYYWPPVLDTYELLDWERLDGSFDYFPAVRFSPEGYQGPCLCTTVRTWGISPFTITAVTPMQPTRIYYASPFFTANIPECLHVKIGLQCDIGSTDTTYDENAGSTRWFSATNYTTWPATLVAYDDQEPFRGGYLRTVKTFTRPPIPTQVDWTTGA